MMDVLATIHQLTGNTTDQEHTSAYTEVRVELVPASNESLALYEGLPQGQSYSFRIKSDTIPSLKQQSKIVVSDGQVSGFDANDTFITVADCKRQRIGGRFYLTGLCYRDTN